MQITDVKDLHDLERYSFSQFEEGVTDVFLDPTNFNRLKNIVTIKRDTSIEVKGFVVSEKEFYYMNIRYTPYQEQPTRKSFAPNWADDINFVFNQSQKFK